MARFLDLLRSGDWLTRERIRLWALAVLIASLGGLAYLIVTAHGAIDYQGRPLGTDFSNVYAAGTYVLDGKPAAPFDPILQDKREQEIFGARTPFYGWHYPPFFLFLAALLALMPYLPALAVWQATTLGLYLLAIRAILTGVVPSPPWGEGQGDGAPNYPSSPVPPHPADLSPRGRGEEGEALAKGSLWLLLALAFPAVFVNLGHGHNGFLTAALMGGALVLLDSRPIVAGILFGLLAYKPQFGLMIPLVLLATGRWRAIVAAAATVAALALATTLAFGPHVWDAFLASTHFTRVTVLEAGQTGWHKIQSVFSWVRMWGGPVPLAYAVQGLVTVALAVALIKLWRSPAAYACKAAALATAAILATPYSLDYDMMVLAPAIAFLALDGWRRGFGPYEKTVLALVWISPFLARAIAEATLIPIGVIAMLSMFVLSWRRAQRDHFLATAARAIESPIAMRTH